jgi:hypothetical protein
MVPPYQFPVAQIKVQRPDKPTEPFETSGGYIGATSDFVYLAASDRRDEPGDNSYLAAYARDQVLYIQLDPPPEGTSRPRTSIFGSLTQTRLAVTPLLDIWWRDQYRGLRLLR